MRLSIFFTALLFLGCTTTKPAATASESIALSSIEGRSLEFSTKVAYDFEAYFKTAGDREKLSVSLLNAATLDPDDTDTLIKLANLRFEEGKTDEFRKLLEKVQSKVTAKSLDHTKFARLYIEGLDFEQRGFQQKSRDVFRDLTVLNPNFVPAYIHLSMAYLRNLQPDVAKFVLTNSLEINEKDGRLLNAMGLIARNTDENELAMDWFNQALLANPKLAEAYINRATIHLEKKDYDAATPDVEKALELSPQNAEALMLMAIIKINHEGDLNKGKHLLGRAIRANPSQSLAKMRLAEVYIQEKKELDFARKLLNNIVNDKNSNYSMIESAKNYLESIK